MAHESLKGKTALITGAARRIGRAAAMSLAREGVNVIVHYNRSADEARQLCDELQWHGAKSWALQAEFDRPDGQAGLIGRAIELAGSIDFLVNNASVFQPSKLLDLNFDHLVADLRVNAFVPFDLCREFARQAGRGKIVNMLDARLRGYDRDHVAYILSKHTLELLTRMLAMELAPHVAVNAVAPGLVLPPQGQDIGYLQHLAGALPMKKHGDAQDVADAIVYLLGSTFITGQTIYVDGGRHLREQGNGPNPH